MTLFKRKAIRALAAAILTAALVAVWQLSRQGDAPLGPTDRAALDSVRVSLANALSYDHRTLSDDLSEAQRGMTTAFAAEFGETFDKTAGSLAPKNKAVVEASVAAVGLVSRDDDEALVLAFVDQARREDKSEKPQIVTSRVSVELREVDGRWLINDIHPF